MAVNVFCPGCLYFYGLMLFSAYNPVNENNGHDVSLIRCKVQFS